MTNKRVVVSVGHWCLVIGHVFAIAAVAAAADIPLVVPVQGEWFEGELESIDSRGRLRFRVVDTTRTLAFSDFVRWSHPRSPKPPPPPPADFSPRAPAK